MSTTEQELVTPPNPLAQDLTYLGLLNNLRARNTFGSRAPVTEAFACTGSAHLAGEHIRCTSPAHDRVQPIPGGNAITPVIGQPLNGWPASTSGFDPADHPEAFPAIAQERGTIQRQSSSPAVAVTDEPVVIPDDGKEHDCACGHPGYRVSDRHGWLPPVVADNEGRPCQWCHTCDRELEPGKPA